MNQNQLVPLKARISWGMGGWADNFIFQMLMILALPIYNIELGIDPVWVGMALMLPRLFDAITDPLMGNISDNTRSRWGRRRPWIFVGALLSAILLPLLWMPPFSGKEASIIYFAIVSTVYALTYTMFVVPYTALGFELSNDYDERTKAMSWRMYIGLLAGLCIPNLYAWCQHDIFEGDILKGARWVSLIVAVTVLITGLLPAILCRENIIPKKQEKLKLGKALIETIKDGPFRLLLSGYVIIITGLLTSAALALYVNIYHVFAGDKKLAAEVSALGGMLAVVGAYLGVRLAAIISAKTGKKETMIIGLSLALISVGSMIFTMQAGFQVHEFWGFKFHPQAISFFFYGMGQQGCWLLIDSMTADICDEDELRSDRRREGMFGAVKSLALKSGVAITGLTGGLVIKFAGVSDATQGVDVAVAATLHKLFIIIQASGLVAGIIIFIFYPITRAKSAETRRLLDARNSANPLT
ncbi:MFS transporter [Lentisphaera profundi]|uniref:MFS transporter n=1 Tax=Lentisphaera profundi TaxID=1658616 RepID=A0ABY7VTD6_9BACT|nr:MFS transporter [Lentisphaera profundi]WDE97171.1 MFS transporter [Lentisphaera profundi]